MSKKWNLTVAPTSLYCLFASNRMKRQVLVNLELYRSTDRANFEDLKVTGNWLLGCLDSCHTNRDEFWLEVAFRRKNYVFFFQKLTGENKFIVRNRALLGRSFNPAAISLLVSRYSRTFFVSLYEILQLKRKKYRKCAKTTLKQEAA